MHLKFLRNIMNSRSHRVVEQDIRARIGAKVLVKHIV